ncbi:MAG: general stress protein [Capsulimonas sp.]|uniref:general stress protein n=1 Tax=Capsulimonas sp. TaxID=2494211 RepID=UPI00326561A9
MTSTLPETNSVASSQSVVAIYRSHIDAEEAVRRLAADGLPVETISIIGRNFESHEDVQGFYRPADAAIAGAGDGAWFGGIFGLMLGAMGFFIVPALGAFMVMGPLSGMIAGAIGGAGVGALINGLIALGIPKDQALKYQERLQAGEFLVVVHGNANEVSRAHEVLHGGLHTHLETHGSTTGVKM